MLSLLCRAALGLRSSFSISTALAGAIAGCARYSSTSDSEWTPKRQYASKKSELDARRRATDPEYRARKDAVSKAWRESNKVAVADRDRLRSQRDPVRERARALRHRASHDYEQLYWAPLRARYASDHHYKQRESLRKWVYNVPRVRHLTWPTHKPIISEKIVRYCGGCAINRSRKLWWQDNRTDEFLCNPCFTSDWSRALPIGYEDKVFGARKYKSRSSKTTPVSRPDTKSPGS